MKDILKPIPIQDELESEKRLRPVSFEEFPGQEEIIQNLKIFIQAAKKRGEALDHILFCGPPGLGKTTLATILAQEMGVHLNKTSGPVLEKAGDLAGLLTKLNERDILFIDEIHALNRNVEEYLYPAIEDFSMDLIVEQGIHAKSIKLSFKPFTLIGATTRIGLLTSPLRSRFGYTARLDFYRPEILQKIIIRSAHILNIEIDAASAMEIAQRARGTPRIANRLLKRARDVADVVGDGKITRPIAQRALAMLGIDEQGLDEMDRNILSVIIQKFSGGPVGINTISVAIGEESHTLEEVYEPFLIQQGYIKRTPRGREVTESAYTALNLPKPSFQQQNLF